MKNKKYTAVYRHEVKGWCHIVEYDTNKAKVASELRKAGYKKVTVLSEKEIDYIVSGDRFDLDYVMNTMRYNEEVLEYVQEVLGEEYTKNSVENKTKETEKYTKNSVENKTKETEKCTENSAENKIKETEKRTENSVKAGKIICKIDILAELKKNGYNTSRIRNEKIIAECVLTELRKGIIRKVETLAIICSITGLDISDIIEFEGVGRG